MEKKKSKKHHYLPSYYLHGFTNDEGGFWVYNKSTGKIFPSGPDDTFFENNLNTVTFPDGNTSDFLEDLYTDVENRSWLSLDRIRNSTHNTQINPLDMMSLYLFLLNLHWRLPGNFAFIESLSKEFFQGKNDFDYFKIVSKTGDIVPVEIIEMIKTSSAFRKSTKMVVSLAPFFKDKNWVHNLENWRFIYSGDDKVWYMVGDNPIITRGDNDHDPINCLKEFIFPVSGKILLVNCDTHEGNMLPGNLIIKYNLAIIQRAQRFVACQRKDFLEALIDLYKLHSQYKKEDDIITELFDSIKTGQ
ncbi:MAG: DUF4238 domain-containing protein [Anaerolineales bacterium]